MRIKNFLSKNLIWIIIAFSALIRLWILGSNPPHLTPDEASIGYNAYSILKTGRDEYGSFLPVIFKSFGDYKPGLYIYLAVPSVAVFGLTEFAVRLPSALSGIMSVYLIFLIVLELFKNKKLALISAFVASITPWLVYFSRGAWEVNTALTLTLAGIYFFLRSLKDSKNFILSAVFFALTLTSYQGAKLSTGIAVLILGILYWKDIFKFEKKHIYLSVIAAAIIASPIILSLFTGQAGRLEVFSVFSYSRPKEYIEAMLVEGGEKIGDASYFLFHSESVNFLRGIMGRFFNHFSGRFLFFEGDWGNPRHSAPNAGMLLLGDVIFLIAGVFYLFSKKLSREEIVIVLWLLLSPLPAVLSRDQVHAVRALNMSIPLVVIISLGIYELTDWANKLRFKDIALILIGLVYFAGFAYFLDAYFIHLPKHDSKYWEYGYKQIVEAVAPIQGNYKKIKVQQSFSQPYIYFLFYQKYDPVKYQRNAVLTLADSINDVGYVVKLDNIEFSPIDWSVNRGESGTLFVADTVRIPPEDSKDPSQFDVIREITYLNGRDTAFRIIGVK